jgi:nucleoside-diphosphate-sugar epimerase
LKILVTGANGFVGRVLCPLLEQSGNQVTRVVRNAVASEEKSVGNITEKTNWSFALENGVDAVVHLAAKVPLSSAVAGSSANETLEEYCRVNAWSTENFARQCAAKGVKRFVFISTVKILGEGSSQPYQADDLAIPCDAYAISKWEAEQTLWEISAKTGLEVVVVRSPLVYGPGVKGNLARLLKLVRLGLPLPLAALQNKRSLIGLDNLVDLLIRCVDHPAAAGQTFLVSDGEDLSTPDLIRHMAAAMGRSARLFPAPVSLLRLVGSALGKRAEIDRLVGSLQIDSSHTRQVLGWTPPLSVQEGIRRMVQGA